MAKYRVETVIVSAEWDTADWDEGGGGVYVSPRIFHQHGYYYMDTASATFEVWATNSGGSDGDITLEKTGTPFTVYATVTVPASTTTVTRFTDSIDLIPANESNTSLHMVSSETTIVVQKASHIRHYETPEDVGNDQGFLALESMTTFGGVYSTTSETFVPVPSQLYYTYNEDDSDPAIASAYLYQNTWSSSDMYTTYSGVEEDNGSYSDWTSWRTGGNSSGEGWVLQNVSQLSSLTNGYHYRGAVRTTNSMATASVGGFQIRTTTTVGDGYSTNNPQAAQDLPIYGDGGDDEAQGCRSYISGSTFDCTAISFAVWIVGTPTDGLRCRIHSGSIDGTVMATSETRPASGIPHLQRFAVYFTSPATLTTANYYYIEFYRTGSRDESNYYVVVKEPNFYSYQKDSSSWSQGPNGGPDITLWKGYATIAKISQEVALAVEPSSGTGLMGAGTHFGTEEYDPDDGTVTYYHEHQGSSSGSSSKLQKDIDGTPTDITNSTVTGENVQRSSALSGMPTTADYIDCYVVTE